MNSFINYIHIIQRTRGKATTYANAANAIHGALLGAGRYNVETSLDNKGQPNIIAYTANSRCEITLKGHKDWNINNGRSVAKIHYWQFKHKKAAYLEICGRVQDFGNEPLMLERAVQDWAMRIVTVVMEFENLGNITELQDLG